MKISFVGLYEELNLGDPVIARCTEWLFLKHTEPKEIKINRVTLDYTELHKKETLLYKIVRQITKKLRLKKWRRKNYQRLMWNLDYEYFKSKFIDSDFIVVVGGGLVKYKYQLFWLHLSVILYVAEKLSIPVFLNSLGVEGYEEKNERCQFLKRFLQRKSLSRVTIRDDYSLFFQQYLNGKSVPLSYEVADPAVWAKEVFSENLKEDKEIKEKNIGLGIARGEIFETNGLQFSKDQAKSLYVSIVKILQQEGFNVQLFTNGLKKDNDFADEIFTELESTGISISNVIKPKKIEDLMITINSFEAIVATRLHACIIAYTLNIPAVGIVWNDKFVLWGKKIGSPENFIKQSEWNPKSILAHLNKARNSSYNEEYRQNLKESISNDIKEIVNTMRKLKG